MKSPLVAFPYCTTLKLSSKDNEQPLCKCKIQLNATRVSQKTTVPVLFYIFDNEVHS